jgi:6-phosphogluconolactonase (cycloisomerase 2 family)
VRIRIVPLTIALACLVSGLLPSGAAVAALPGGRTVYVTNSDDPPSISTFAVDLANGRPTRSGALVPAGAGVRMLVFTPDARMAYAVNTETDSIFTYQVGGQGKLTRVGDPVPTGSTPFGTVVTPDGRMLYTAQVFGDSIAAFAIGSDGALNARDTKLTEVPGPRGLAVTPDGRFLYVGHGDPGPGRPTSTGAISTYAINADGTLTLVGAPIRVGRFCGALSITPDGRRVYMTCTDTDDIHGFSIGSDGRLTVLPGSPYKVFDFPEGITTSPDGGFVYVASLGIGTDPETEGRVTGYAIAPDGALKPVAEVLGGTHPVGITPLPDGRFLYDSNSDSGDVSAFAVGRGGTLRLLTTVPTGGSGPAFNSASVLPNQGPVARFLGRALGRTVSFDASASTDADGLVARYSWDFGDGTTLVSASPRVAHQYAQAGTFRVTLVVTDNEGCSTTLVSTGQAVLCNGTKLAASSIAIVVRAQA